MLASGTMVVHGLALQGGALVTQTVLWLVVMLLVALNEEYMFRGYPLQALTRGMGFWPAAVLLSLLFGAAHLTKPHENAIDIINIILLGLLLCLTLQRTGSLWLAVGFHASFDFMQFFVIGTRNGGAQPIGHLVNSSFPGPAWANGGPLGTEASYFMLPAIALLFAYILLRYPKPTPLQTRHDRGKRLRSIGSLILARFGSCIGANPFVNSAHEDEWHVPGATPARPSWRPWPPTPRHRHPFQRRYLRPTTPSVQRRATDATIGTLSMGRGERTIVSCASVWSAPRLVRLLRHLRDPAILERRRKFRRRRSEVYQAVHRRDDVAFV